MAIDPNIILQGAAMQQEIQQRNNAGLQNLIGAIGQIGYDSKVRKMRQLQDPKEQQAFANNSIFANRLNTQLTADRAAAAKAAADQLKFDADLGKTYAEIGKISSESGKIGAETGKISTETGITRQNNTGSIWSAFLTGGPVAAKAQLENMKNNGVISPESYQAELDALTNMPTNAAEAQQYALGRFKGLQDPKYSLTTADNVLDNAQSDKNSQRAYEASIYGTDKTAETADENRALQMQRLEFEKGKISPLYTEGQAALKNGAKFETIGGVTYIDLGNGKGIPYVDQDGKPLSATSKANGVPKLSDNALKQVNEASTQLSQARQSYTKIGGLVNDLKGGKLDLSASNIVAAKGRMALGLSTPNDLAIDRFQAALNQAANDVLMMAKGTQTEGDAQRAVATITANPPRDNNAAMQALNTLAGIQRNTINTLNGSINTIYDNYGIARPGINKPSQNGGGSPANNTGGRSSLSSILFE